MDRVRHGMNTSMERNYMKKKFAAAARYSYTRLALNYYMYFEEKEADLEESPFGSYFSREFHRLMGQFLKGEKNIEDLNVLRKKLIHEMEILTAYTDCFQVYEHVINRLEPKYLPEELKTPFMESDEELTEEIMSFLRDSKDSAVMNDRIQMVMEQLPVRFTKSKFFSLVQTCLSIYKGSPKSSLDALFYVLRTESMVQLPEKMEEDHKGLWNVLEELKKADYRSLEKDAYEELVSQLGFASQRLMDDSGDILLYMDLINDLYVLFLSLDDGMMEVTEEKNFVNILTKVHKRIESSEQPFEEEEAEALLAELEGKQERYFEKWLRLENPSPALEREEEREQYLRLSQVERLLSGSPFAELEEEEEDRTEVDEALLKQEEEKLFGQWETLWKGMPKVVVRAVMARVLSNLPVCFYSSRELEEYIKNSLGGCTDADEKAVSMDLIR